MTWRMTLLALVMLLPASAHAHLTDTGLGPAYDGAAHLLLSPDDLLPVLALALLAGLNGAGAGRLVLLALPAAWLLGGVAGAFAGPVAVPISMTAVSLLVLGIMTAASVRLAPAPLGAVAIALGLAHGWLNGAAIATAQRDPTGVLGIAVAVFVVVALASAAVVALRAPWTRIAVRVAGSWIAAVGVLMVGWGLRSAVA